MDARFFMKKKQRTRFKIIGVNPDVPCEDEIPQKIRVSYSFKKIWEEIHNFCMECMGK